MNKRGQLGKIITSLPVLLLIILVIAIYLISVGLIGFFRMDGPDIPSVVEGIELDNVLLRDINIEVDGVDKSKIVFDWIVDLEGGGIDRYDFGRALKEMVVSEKIENNCLVIAKGESRNSAGLTGAEASDDYFIKFVDGEAFVGSLGNTPLILGGYESEGLLRQVSFNDDSGKRIYFQYYYGGCLE